MKSTALLASGIVHRPLALAVSAAMAALACTALPSRAQTSRQMPPPSQELHASRIHPSPQGESSSPQISTFEAVTVRGNWLDDPNQEKVLEHAGARTIIDRTRMQESASSSVRDVLRLVPGVQVQDSNGTGGSDVGLNLGVRGLSARLSPRSYVLMDGIPVSYAPYGQPQLSLAPVTLGNLTSVDVIRGAGSVRHGPQNVGGILNFVTRDIPKEFAAEVATGAEYYGHTGNVKATPSFFVGGTSEHGLGAALLYSGIHGKGWRSSNDKTDIDDVLLKGAYRPNGTSTLSARVHHFEGEGRMPGGLTTAEFAADPFQSTRRHDEFTGRRTDGSVKYLHDDGINNLEVLTYYVDSFRGSHIEQEQNGRRRLTAAPRNYHYYGIESRYSRLFELGEMVHEVSVGHRYLKERAHETALRTAFYTPGTEDSFAALPLNAYQHSNGATHATALFIDDRIDWGNWTLTPGVRYERIRTFNDVSTLTPATGTVTATRRPAANAHEWLPTLSVRYRLQDGWSVFANAGKSFGPQQYGQLAQSERGLHPETATTYELGSHFDNAAWHGELTLFNIDFDKELLLTRVGVDGLWTNLGATRHRGVESALRYDFAEGFPALKGLSAGMTYTFTRATSAAGNFAGRDLPLYSRHVAALNLRYVLDRWTFNADLSAQSRQHAPGSGTTYVTQENASGQLGDVPGFALLNLRAGYSLGPSWHNATLGAGVRNVLDRRYYTRSSDNNGGKYVGMPRTVFVQATLPF